MSLERLLTFWKNTPQIADNITRWERIPARTPQRVPLPPELHPSLRAHLERSGFEGLYSHQASAWEHARAGRHVVVATGTASGKTLCYNLPVLDHLLRIPNSRALYLFPTKALAQDQYTGLLALLAEAEAAPAPAIYDGDTANRQRAAIRDHARLVLTNPDMLHVGILPFHTRWAEFFANLRFVVIDEMHIYRGVFGSHVANVLRRLKRIAAHYGAAPQFLLTSATIGNPVELAEKLVEGPVELVARDGSARGGQHFLIYNPPVVDPELNLRRSVLQESVFLAGDLIRYGVQSILFGRSRRTVELLLRGLREANPAGGESDPLRSYRSGYLPAQRRAIEQGIRSGEVRVVAATTALELGIDIGGMGAVVLSGYPGSISGTWQQAGRAGRGMEESLAVLLTNSSPLDQYLAQHPEFFFSQSPESALINPDNLLILLEHIRCAAYERPFAPGEGFGLLPGETVAEFLDYLAGSGALMLSGGRYFWTGVDAPAPRVSLRTASAARIALMVFQDGAPPQTIGEVDAESAPWMVHPGAVYLHLGEAFLVEELDLAEGSARMRPFESDYYTEPKRETDVSLIALRAEESAAGCEKAHGEVLVTTQVTGYRKVQWGTQLRLADEALDMPPSRLETTGYWLVLDEEVVEALRESGLWTSDPNAYGPGWPAARDAARQRDRFTCQSCGLVESGRTHDVHHKVPFRSFTSAAEANRLDNLVTLCPACHRRAEAAVRMRSGLAGLGYVLGNLAPLYLMCDPADIVAHADPRAPLSGGRPSVIIYERIPAGIGFAQRLFEVHAELVRSAHELVMACPCPDGCPSCVGPGGELGAGGKPETLAILERLRTDVIHPQ